MIPPITFYTPSVRPMFMTHPPPPQPTPTATTPTRLPLRPSSAPRRCGIATFPSDLLDAARAADPGTTGRVAAIDEPSVLRPYRSEVRWRIRQGVPESYVAAAREISSCAPSSLIAVPANAPCTPVYAPRARPTCSRVETHSRAVLYA
mgnify:CR=1 FL=1